MFLMWFYCWKNKLLFIWSLSFYDFFRFWSVKCQYLVCKLQKNHIFNWKINSDILYTGFTPFYNILGWAQTNPTFHPTLQKFMLDEMLDAFALIRKSMLDEKTCWMMLDETLNRFKIFIQHYCQFKANSSVGCVCGDFIQHCSDLERKFQHCNVIARLLLSLYTALRRLCRNKTLLFFIIIYFLMMCM